MNRFKTNKVGKTTSAIVGLATAAWLSFGALVAPLTASAVTIDELLAQIAVLQAQLLTLQGSSVSTADKCSFTRSLTVGSRGDDVTCLQNYLKGAGHLSVNATGYFGSLTKAAAASWQSANGVSPAVGYFGSISRAKYDSMTATAAASSASSAASSASSVAATGEGLTITAATQPAATLAVKSAARLPFTKVTLTAGAQDVTVTGITVERTGLANDAAFAGVVLLDETGTQLGIAKTFNSDHKATVGDTVTIKAGASKTFTVGGNMASDQTSYAGQVAYLSVTGVTTSATVSGLLPISGAGHTINNSLTIGSVTNAVGSVDPRTNPSKPVGTTGYTFSAVKFTAGSAEKIKVHSIRWNQSGSVGSADLANVKTYIDGTAYDTAVSSDGKYYTSTFASGLTVDKGGFVEMSIKGDIVGGSGRTIDFDIYKNTDVNVSGETYGYGVTPPNGSADDDSTADESEFLSTNPWYDASQVTVSSGTITVTKATSVAATNIAENVANQTLGGFTVEVKGESISANNLVFRFQLSSGAGDVEDITNISLYDENGSIVAGPADGSGTDLDYGSVTFSDTVTFPIGVKTYTLKGKLGTNFVNDQTIVASTTPSSNWSNVTGQTTGNSISGTSITSSIITGNTMTVKSATLAISVSTNPVAQTVVSGIQGLTFANYILDANSSGEDIKFTTIPLEYNTGGGTATNVNNCILYDGSTALNTGSNVVNPTAAGSSTSFTLDTALTVSKNTTKTLALKCNIVAGATGTYRWGYDSSSTPTITGVTSGQSVYPTENDSAGQAMSLTANGSLTVAADSSAPSYGLVAANSNATIGVFKFSAANEAIKLTKLGLKLTTTASTTVSDLTQVTLWDGSTQVGSLVFTGATGTSTLSSDFIVPKDGDKLLTLKANLTKVGASEPGSNGAVIAIDYIGSNNAQGTGQSSGVTINSTSAATAFSGARMFRSYPVFAKISVPSTTLVTGTMDLYRFSVSANPSTENGIGLHTLNINVATSSGSNVSGTTTVTTLKVYAYTDSSFSTAVSGSYTAGQVVADITGLANSGDNVAALSSILQIPAGSTYYFRVVATVTLTAGTGTFSGSVSTKITADTAYPSLATTLMGTAAGISSSKLIWSPNATTSSTATHVDWTNGYGVSGLTNIDTVTISK